MKLAHCFFLIDGFVFFFFPCGFQKPRDDECAFLQGICDFLQGPNVLAQAGALGCEHKLGVGTKDSSV